VVDRLTHTYTNQYLLVLLVSFGLAVIFTYLGKQAGLRLNVLALPGGRRQHKKAISMLGGIGIAAGFFGALILSQMHPIPTADPNESRRLWGLIIGGLLMFILGLADDYFDLPPWVQYLGYLTAALVAIGTLIILERFNNPFNNNLIVLPALIYIPLSIFWITGMIVTVNWLDGLDGLAAGVTAILCAILAIHMIREQQYSVAPQAIALFGASLGFLVFNVHPAKVFMGSNGAFMLGYLAAALALIAGARVATVLMVMGIPIIDVAWTIIDRLRHGASPFKGDRHHLHYRLLDAGISTRTIVLLYWSFCALFGALALLISSRIYKLVALGILGTFTIALLIRLSQE